MISYPSGNGIMVSGGIIVAKESKEFHLWHPRTIRYVFSLSTRHEQSIQANMRSIEISSTKAFRILKSRVSRFRFPFSKLFLSSIYRSPFVAL